jgi:hypothetical protein
MIVDEVDVDELAILVLRTAGRKEAIEVYEEVTGCSRAESVQAVENLSRRASTDNRAEIARRMRLLVSAITGTP